MTNKYQQSIEDIVDSMFEVTENDQEFANEVLNDFNSEYQYYIKKGADAINSLVGRVKLKYGEQQHLRTNVLINKIKQLSKDKFIELVKKYRLGNKQLELAIEFHRKLQETEDINHIKDDSILVELMKKLDEENSDELTESNA